MVSKKVTSFLVTDHPYRHRCLPIIRKMQKQLYLTNITVVELELVQSSFSQTVILLIIYDIKETSFWPNHMQSCNICVHAIPASNPVSYTLLISKLEVKLMKHFAVSVISNSSILLASYLVMEKRPKKKSKNSRSPLKNFWNFIRISTKLAILLVITWLWPILPSTVVSG